jgi:predicted MFS family arabinose efflux permease
MTDGRNYAAVTLAYWVFTLTDGALRMLVLLHFHRLGFSPLDLAFLFLLYEAMGIVTNFGGGWLGARFGLRLTLFTGLGFQIFALLMLSAMDSTWAVGLSVSYVMGAQALSGVAKDLTKMSSKSAVKLVVAEDAPGRLFRWIALLTGSKNALKGLGFLLGGVMLQGLGFQVSLWVMAGTLVLALLVAAAIVTENLGKAKSPIKVRELFAKTHDINCLSMARVFLFASRDVWFVVGVPVFLYSTFGWSFDQVGAFMAAWVIGYGIIQASVPRFLPHAVDANTGARAAKVWVAILAGIPALIAVGLSQVEEAAPYFLVGGLFLFGAVFAVNSAVHSFLIVAYSDTDKVAMNVGFYYMANAVGRLSGTLLSGLVFQYYGLTACLWVSAGLVTAAFVFTLPLGKSGQAGSSMISSSTRSS